jgi:hypothetical protein
MRLLAALALTMGLYVLPGCAMLTGTLTGAFTGAVDAPAQTYRENRSDFIEHPILFSLDVLVVGPVGLVCGPLAGLGKGLSLDVQLMMGQVKHSEVYGSYGPASVWRPYTWKWPSRVDISPQGPLTPVLPPETPAATDKEKKSESEKATPATTTKAASSTAAKPVTSTTVSAPKASPAPAGKPADTQRNW